MSEIDDKKIIESSMNLINQTYGIGRDGAHKKECDICGCLFSEPNDLLILAANGPSECPFCAPVHELEKLLINHWNKIMSREFDNEIHNKNMVRDYNGPYESYITDKCTQKYAFINRTNKVINFINKVDSARLDIYLKLKPYIRILESYYEKRDIFWKEGGDLGYFTISSILDCLIIKLKEYLDSNKFYSIKKIRNIILNDKKALFEDHKIILTKKFDRSGDVFEMEIPHFEIDKYFCKIDLILSSYSKTIDAIKDFRDTQAAHLDKMKKPEATKAEMTLINIRRIFNAIRIIYDGFLFSVAPDMYGNIVYEPNLFFGHLNDMTRVWEKEIRKK